MRLLTAGFTFAMLTAANAAPCVPDTVASYILGFSCNVGNFTFSNINIFAITSGNGSNSLEFSFNDTISPYAQNGFYGLQLNYTSQVDAGLPSSSDLTWSYNVVGVPSIQSAYLRVDGSGNGPRPCIRRGGDQVYDRMDCALTLRLRYGNLLRLSKKSHSLPSSIKRIIQTKRPTPARTPMVRPPFGSSLTSVGLQADAHPPG